MRRTVIYLLLLLVCVAGALIAGERLYAMRQRPSGGLICEKVDHDFGNVELTDAAALEHVFVLVNRSNHAIHLKQPVSSCGCTVAKLPTTVLEPGARIDVPVTANWSLKAGSQSENVIIATELPQTERLVLNVVGNVLIPIAAMPSYINFGNMSPFEEQTREILISPATAPKVFHVKQVTVSSPYMTVNEIPRASFSHSGPNESPSAVRYSLHIKAPLEASRFQSPIIFQTDLPGPDIKVFVEASFLGAFTALPQSILLNYSPDTEIRKHVNVKYNRTHVIDLPAVKIIAADNAGIQLRSDALAIENIVRSQNHENEFSFELVHKANGVVPDGNLQIVVSHEDDRIIIPVISLSRQNAAPFRETKVN